MRLTQCTRKRGLRSSASRQCLLVIVVVMLGSTTASVVIQLNFYIVQIPSLGVDTPFEVIRQIKHYSIGTNWLTRLNASLLYVDLGVSLDLMYASFV
jgi:hypothetical protein